MVKRVFWENPLQETCTATVTNITTNPNTNNFIIELDQTIFYAFSGGQASDHGTINNITVLKATKIDDQTIQYELDSQDQTQDQTQNSPIKVGDKVEVRIDLTRRKKLMKLHSAVHIICFIFEKMTDIHYSKCIGSNVEPHKARLDYELDHNISKYFEELTQNVNAIFTSDHPIVTFNNPDNPNRREWKCESLNMHCPCGGTHVTNTNQIGKVKFKRKNIGSGKERIEVILIE